MFYKWKASTTKLLIGRLKPPADGRVPVDQENFNYLVDRVLRVLGSWLTTDEVSCRRDLESIFQSAIDFDSHMNEQFSSMYALSTPVDYTVRHSFPFDNTLMEATSKDIQMADSQPVGIVLSPALIRSGTANGDEYYNTWVLVKSRVLPQGFLSSSQRPKNSKTRMGTVMGSVHKRLIG